MNDQLQKHRIIGIIPARLPSSRLPEKALKDIAGKSLVQRVYECAIKAEILDDLYVATDDQKIVDHAESFGAKAVLTADTHPSGTDRVFEALQKIEEQSGPCSIAVNIQGDMPFVSAAIIDRVVQALLKYLESGVPESGAVSTLAFPIKQQEDFLKSDTAKVVFNTMNEAMYFSRAAIPFKRGDTPQDDAPLGYQHVGLYVYHRKALERFTALAPCQLEQFEMLEQLRGLYHGIPYLVHVEEVPNKASTIEVNTPEDLEFATAFAKENSL